MDLISEALHYIGKNYPNSKAVQLGAMDGINFDDTRGFFDMYKWKTILVEPIPEIYEELKENLKDRENLIYENSAVGVKNGELKMLTVPIKSIKENNLEGGYKGMSATYPLKNGFGSNYQRDIDVKAKFGVDLQVPCLTFDSLIEKHGFKDVNILICDIEGYDWEVFKTIDLNKYDLKFIRLEYINLTEQEKEELKLKLTSNGYTYNISHQDIDAIKTELYDKFSSKPKTIKQEKPINSNYTIVSGLWDIGRNGRDFNTHYLPRFEEFLKIDSNMILFLPKKLEEIVWKHRSKSNTYIKILELEDIKNTYYAPHWDKTQEIRNSSEWQNITGEGGWLKTSPQATLEYYNPIVQSKMFFLHDASIFNNFNTEYFYWVDAGLTSSVPAGHLGGDRCLDNIIEHTDPFIFLSYPYETLDEIHGFNYKAMKHFAKNEVKYVCRGGLFGGHKEAIRGANGTYYSLLSETLNSNYMGTEESIFSIMAVREPQIYKRFMLDDNGLVVKFTEALIKNNVKLESIPENLPASLNLIPQHKLDKIKTNLYILTFNFPEQLIHTINSMKKTSEWLEKPNLVLLDNSTNNNAKLENQKIAKEYNFEYINLEGNKGICGGRQAAAEHFDKSDSDFYFFFEDDMTSNPPEEKGKFCRNGLKKYIPNLYEILHKIMLKEDFDYLKMSFTEVYWDNNIQTSWYNVPQEIRTKYFPNYDQLPITGNDPNAPRTKFNVINNLDGVAYIDGEVTYTNWPMIMSKKGNKKVFIDTKWAHPYEQTWMSYVFQEQKKGNIKAAVLLASPIWHDRIKYYSPEERREN